jgi:Na+-transporting NADH:ubiquinone oxidoreductase subunit F
MRLMRVLHKWLSLILGAQLLLWTVSGLVFAWLEHERVTAHDSLREPAIALLDAGKPLMEPAGLLAGSERPLDVTLLPLLGDWFYRLRFVDRVELLRASDGAPFPISEPVVRALAAARYAGPGALRAVSLREPPVMEARDAGTVWEAAFDDPDRTSLYFSAEDGRLVAARNDTWRLFDVFWMLHTMDFRSRDNFNNPLVILFTTGSLWVGITGLLLLLQVFGVTRKLESGLRSRASTRRA